MSIGDIFCPQSIMFVMCYDKLILWKEGGYTPHNVDTIIGKLDDGNVSKDINTGRVIVSGYKKGLKVSVYPSGISVIGSLPKFLYDDNIHPITRATTGEAVEAISEALGFDISNARVNGLEFGYNFPMSKPVPDYLLRLGELERMIRYKFSSSTLYYKPRGKKQPKVLCFYDKIADAKTKGLTIPVGFEDANLLKYELRLKGRLSDQLGINNITASTLSERNLYKKLIVMYQSFYKSIYKQKQIIYDMSNIKTPNDAFKYLMGRFLNEGEQGKIDGFIEELKGNETFEEKKYYSRVRTMLKEAANMAGRGLEDAIIKELDNDIDNLGAYI